MLGRWLLAGLLSVVGLSPATAQSDPKPAGEKPKAAVDLYGDPLPPGAVARLGTVRFRLTTEYWALGIGFLADNKTVVTASGQHVQFWDAASGRLGRDVRTEMQISSFALSPDRARA